MAQETGGQYLSTSLCDGNPLPDATPLEYLPKDDDAALANLICVNLGEYAALTMIKL